MLALKDKILLVFLHIYADDLYVYSFYDPTHF